MDLTKILFKSSTAASESDIERAMKQASSVSNSNGQYLGREPRTRMTSATVAVEDRSFQVDAEFHAELQNVLAKAKLPGYPEFLDQMDVLKDVVVDENVRVVKALQSVERMLKITPDQIVASVQERVQILENERAVFESHISDEIHQTVETSEKTVAGLSQAILENEAQQQQLQQSHDSMVTARAKAQASVQQVQSEASAVRTRFKSAYQPHETSLKTVLNKIQNRSTT